MILMIDNYDSFTYNLVQYCLELGAKIIVKRNDEIDVAMVRALAPQKIIISPGPGRPEAAGQCLAIIDAFKAAIPILGVCLGHQALAYYFGARVGLAQKVMHAKTSAVEHNNTGVFENLPSPLIVGRYHSLIVEAPTLPKELLVTAYDQDNKEVMGVRHRELDLEGVQFHPESVLTEYGHQMMNNFLKR